jgi:DNA-binding SARP family transcriptional activator
LAGRLFHHAFALWQGEPLAGIPGPSAESRRVQLTELYVAAAEEGLATDIAAGQHVVAIAELRALLAEYPFREGLSELLMLALYKSGCQADALGVFDVVRRKLRDELGIGPGPALQTMYQRILHADGRLMEVAGARAGRRPGARPVSLAAEPMVA